MNRRALLQLLSLAPALAVSSRVYAAPESSPRFLLVFLRGGYDCANALVPYRSEDYYALRPTLAVPKPGSRTDGRDAMELDAHWALAPALRGTLGSLYQQHEAAFIPFAGCGDLSRSHFETQDTIELGQAPGDARDLRSGFMARLAAQLNGAGPIAFTDSLPVAFRGATDIPNLSLRGVGKPVFDARQAGILSSLYTGHPLQAAVRDGLELRQEVSRAIQQEMTSASRDAITPTGFELEAQRVGRLMREQYRLGFIDVGGWDTHVNQGAAEGVLASNLASLGQGLLLLKQELGAAWSSTVVVVLSEFGRTFRENGDRGTDHGHGSVHWVLGGPVRGGRVVGEQVDVTRSNLFQDRDFPVLNDYRAVLGGLFATLWGLSAPQLEQVFPRSTPVSLGIV